MALAPYMFEARSQTNLGDVLTVDDWLSDASDFTSPGVSFSVKRPNPSLLPSIAGQFATGHVLALVAPPGPEKWWVPDWGHWRGYHFRGLIGGTGGALIIASSLAQTRDGATASVSAMVAGLRAALSLNMTEVARVLRVERPTVYSWLRDEATPQRSNSIRLSRLTDIANQWRRHSEFPLGNAVRLPDARGCALVDLLAEDPIPEEQISVRLEEAAPFVQQESLRRPRVPAIRDSVGHAAARLRSHQSEMDFLTRRPLGPEDE